MLRAQGLPVLRVAGVEADDVIGTLACRAARAGQSVLISTGDKDMAQLVDGSITLVNTMSNTVLDRDGVKAKFDVYPEQIIDYLALVGDSSDNIPGIDKVGPKTAAKLLNQYGTLDNLIRNVQAGERQGRREPARRPGDARAVAQARDHPQRPRPAADAGRARAGGPGHGAPARALYALRAAIAASPARDGGSVEPAAAATAQPPSAPGAAAATPVGRAAGRPGAGSPDGQRRGITRHCRNGRTSSAGSTMLRAAPLIAVDTETTSLDYMSAEIVGLSFCIEPGTAAYLPLGHDYAGAPPQLDRTRALAALKPHPRGSREAEARTPPQVRRPRAAEPRHPPRRHAVRHHARVLRAGTAWARAMTWTPRRCVISGCGPSPTRTWPARAPSRSPSARCRWSAPRSMLPRTPM